MRCLQEAYICPLGYLRFRSIRYLESDNFYGMKRLVLLIVGLLFSIGAYAQFLDCTKGLLVMPSAEMEADGTFMISNSFVNKHYTPNTGSFGWTYHTFGYGFSMTFWSRFEVAYVCTLFNGDWRPENRSSLTERQKIVKNQDRHFSARFQLLKENEFDFKWIPSIVVGICDPVTGGSNGEYIGSDVSSEGNGFFSRCYIAATKHFNTDFGTVGGHLAYQYTQRKDFLATGPCVAVTWEPVWLNRPSKILSSFRVIAEYDSRDINLGLSSSVWKDHFEGWFCLESCRWVNAGLRYKLVLKH